MKEKKIYKKNFVVIIAILLIFSMAIIPNVEANINNDNIQKNNLLKENGFIKILLEKLYSLFNKLGFDLTKIEYKNIQRLNVLQEDSIIIEKCFEYYNNNTIKTKINYMGNVFNNKINDLNTNSSDSIKTFFKTNETFDLNVIHNRINSLKIGEVKKQLCNWLGHYEPNSKQSFVDVYNNSIVDMFKMFNETNSFNNPVGYNITYPLIDEFCNMIADFLMLFAPILLFLFGVNGIFIAVMVGMIFLSPIIIPMSIYVGFIEMCKSSQLWDIIQNEFYNWGFMGVMVYCLPMVIDCFFTSFFQIGLAYVFAHILLNSTYSDDPTSECKPSINSNGNVFFKVNTEMYIDVYVKDWDMLNNQKPRDYLRIGWTIKNDTSFPIYWSNFIYSHGQHIHYDMNDIYDTTMYKNIKNNGGYIYLVCQDNWGVFSDWIKVKVKISTNINHNIVNNNDNLSCVFLFGLLGSIVGISILLQNSNPSFALFFSGLAIIIIVLGKTINCWDINPTIKQIYG